MGAIEEGLKTVSIGKKGSKPLSEDLVQEILQDIQEKKPTPIQLGALLGGLLMKGATKEEKVLLEVLSLKDILQEAPEEIQDICKDLAVKEELRVSESYQLGQFLFSKDKGDGARGLAASILRVRYETEDEYDGLLRAMEGVYEDAFKKEIPVGKPILQIAEPFDGLIRSYSVVPVLAGYLTPQFRVVSMVGRNSGPKFGNNLYDLAKRMHAPFIRQMQDLTKDASAYGHYVFQGDLSKAIDGWVERRQQIIKRPFLATLERFVNPFMADVMVASAFHAPYGEKMIGICERAGFPSSIIVRNGLEGSINFPLLRETKVLASRTDEDGEHERKEFIFTPPPGFKVEEKLENPSLEENTELIQQFEEEGATENEYFNARIKYMLESFNEIITWLEVDHGFVD